MICRRLTEWLPDECLTWLHTRQQEHPDPTIIITDETINLHALFDDPPPPNGEPQQ